MAATVVIQQEQRVVHLPPWVRDLASFRRWAKSDAFPDRGWYGYLAGELWVDPSMERFGHNQIKTKIAARLTLLADETRNGQYLGDRMLLTNRAVDLSTEPDGMFLSFEGLKMGRCRLARGEDSLEVLGTPDMVLEVVSPSSREKDTVILRDLYWRAGVKEYWLAEAGRAAPSFDILRRTATAYSAARKQGGWVKSALFGRSFHLSRAGDPLVDPVFTFAMR